MGGVTIHTVAPNTVPGTKPQMYNVTGPRQTDRTRPDPTGRQKISNQRKMNAPKRAPSYGYMLCTRYVYVRRGATRECANLHNPLRKLCFLHILEIPSRAA